jgi:hypothetical protein
MLHFKFKPNEIRICQSLFLNRKKFIGSEQALHLRVKMVGKILGNTGSVFPYFLVIFVLFGKYCNRYKNRI